MPYYQPTAGYPTYMPQQTRFEAPYASYPQTGQITQPAPNSFICRPVTSREEAVAVQTDFISAGTIMPDLGHGMIYLKRFNPNTGLSDWYEFGLIQPSNNESSKEQTDPASLLKALAERLNSMDGRLAEMADKMDALRPKTATKKGSDTE